MNSFYSAIKVQITVLLFALVSVSTIAEKPNVLFVIFDDLNDAVEGFGGHSQAITPNLDKLAKMGVKFDRAYCNSPLCAPSRPSLLTSTYPHNTGMFNSYYAPSGIVWRNADALRDTKTFMEYFRDHGYKVMGTGKIFHNGDEDWSVWLDPVTGKMNFGFFPSWGPFPWDGKKVFRPFDYSHNEAVRHPNWEGISPLILFTSLADVPHVGPNPKSGAPGFNGWYELGRPFRYVDDEDRDLMADELNAQWVSGELAKKHDKPFMMCVGINRPHGPWIVPQKYFDMYPLETLEMPKIEENDLEDVAQIIRNNRNVQGNAKRYGNWKEKGHDKKWLQAYLASVTFADEQFGKMLSALENSEYADNTIVVVTSDHGYHMGEKTRFFKFSVWEESNRVPLIIAGSGIPEDETCETPVSLIDIYPTLVEYADLPENDKVEGFSLVPLLKEPSKGIWGGPEVALSMVGYNNNKEPEKLEVHYSARSRDFRYVLASNGEEELYDHRVDPQEWRNLAGYEEFSDRKEQLKQQILELVGESPYRPQVE